MAIALSDLVKDLERKEVLEDFIAVGKALGLSTSGWQPGEPIYDLLTIFADQIASLWNNVLVKAIRAAFLDYASGLWLTFFAGTFYETWRQQKTFATGDLILENRSAFFYTVNPGNVRINNSNAKGFANVTGGFLLPWDGISAYPTLTISMQADEEGADSNTAIGDILPFPTVPLSAPAGVYAQTNATAWLGSDEETDAALKVRARLSTGPLSPASPRSAYESIALSTRVTAAGVPLTPRDEGYDTATAVNVNRVKVREPGGGIVLVYLASPAGAASGDNVTDGTDVFYVNALIQKKVVPAGLLCTVSSATEHAINLGVVTVYVDRDSLVTADEANAAVTDAVTVFFETLPIGGQRTVPGGQGWVFIDEIKAKASESLEGIYKVEIAVADVALNQNWVAVPTFSVFAIVVTQ
jgi:hypothetical protein